MANYYGQTRTNYFAVKDADAFEAELGDYNVILIREEDGNGGYRYGFLDADDNGGGLSWSRLIELEDENGDPFDTDVDIDWVDILSRHVADGHVAILMEVGSEKYRYFNGWAIAVNSKGETREINLNMEIDKLARELGENVTPVGY